MIAFMRSAVQKMLSTLVWFPMLWAHSVGMNGGSTIFMLWCANRFSNGCVRSRFLCVKRCVFLASSHSGWCWLKSPIHIMCIGLTVWHCLAGSHMNVVMCVSASLLSPSLYTLIICNVPKFSVISMVVMSGCQNCSCFHVSVERLVFMRMTDLILSGYLWWVFGYTVIHCWLALVLPLWSM